MQFNVRTIHQVGTSIVVKPIMVVLFAGVSEQ
jgi:hypothetical protein